MKLPFDPPLAPMLSSAADALPGGEGWQFEPKWDGFRTLVFRDGRVLRAYNSQRDMIAAEVANGEGPEAVIERFLQQPETAFVHVRSASHGCYTMEVERI